MIAPYMLSIFDIPAV